MNEIKMALLMGMMDMAMAVSDGDEYDDDKD